jgi:response regulator RpfG family c-di-GMP phosphodiesterase
MNNFLVVGATDEVRSLGVLLRSGGHEVTLLAEAAEAFRFLRCMPVHTVLVVGDESDVAAAKFRGRVLVEGLAKRALLVRPVISAGAERRQRFAIGDHRLSESEFLALLSVNGEPVSGDGEDTAVAPGVEALVQVVDVLVGIQELTDAHFRGSAHRSVPIARAVAEKLGLSREEILEVSIATLLKDIGKIGVESGLLENDGIYSGLQRSTMQEHVVASVRLLEHIEFPWKVLPVIRHHHERYDGSGYPDGLKGAEIPVGARIVSAVDAYIAMLSNRPHRGCLSREEAQAELVRSAGTQFDPEVVESLLEAIRRGTVSLSSDERPVVLIADSDVDFMKLIAVRLVNEGIEVRAVTSVEEAILKIMERPPHLVLASCASEPERALHLLRQVREDRELRLTPFAFLTDTEDRVVKIRALRQGADDVLTKRTDLEELVARIDSIIARDVARRAADAPPEQRGITGQIENLGVPDIFQILNLGLKTARVRFEKGEASGTIWFAGGSAVHAEAGDLVGVDACYEIVCWDHGQFCIEHGLETEDTSIEMDTMNIVLEALRRADESAAMSSDREAC